MGLSVRAYAKHRHVSHTAVAKALKAGRIPASPDGTIDPAVADAAWNAAAARGSRPPDARRAGLPPGQLEAAEQLVRDVLADHGVSRGDAALELADVRLANELLKAERQDLAISEQRAHLQAYYGLEFDERGPLTGHPALDVAAWRVWATQTAAELARYVGGRGAEMRRLLAAHLEARLAVLGLVGGAADDGGDDGDDAAGPA